MTTTPLRLLPTAGHLDRSAITLRAHAAVRSTILAGGKALTDGRAYARLLGSALRWAWDAAYEAAASAGQIDPNLVEGRRLRRSAADRKRIAASPLAAALRRIAEAAL